MTDRNQLAFTAVFVVFLLALAFHHTFLRQKNNLVLITVEGLRPDHMGVYGYPRDTTPAMDRLSNKSFVFDRAFLNSPDDIINVGALFAGKLPSDEAPGGDDTIVSYVKKEGFSTAAFLSGTFSGKNQALAGGFDEVFDLSVKTRNKRSSKASAEDVVSKALAWVSQRGEGRFFVWIHLTDTAGPYAPPAPYDSKFLKDEYWGEDRFIEMKKLPPAQRKIGDRAYVNALVSLYDGEVADVDDQVGFLLQGLDDQGILDKTAVVFTSTSSQVLDEGPPFFSKPSSIDSRWLRAPLLVYVPGYQGGRFEQSVEIKSLFQTFFDLVEVSKNQVQFTADGLYSLFSTGRFLENSFVVEGGGGDKAFVYRDFTYVLRGDGKKSLFNNTDGSALDVKEYEDVVREFESLN